MTQKPGKATSQFRLNEAREREQNVFIFFGSIALFIFALYVFAIFS